MSNNTQPEGSALEEACTHQQVQLSANGMYCQCKKCKKILTKKRGETVWHELEQYQLPEQNMPLPDPLDTEAWKASAAYYGRVVRDNNEFYDGFIAGWQQSNHSQERTELLEALREISNIPPFDTGSIKARNIAFIILRKLNLE